MVPEDIEARIAKALVTEYEVPAKEQETVEKVRRLIDQRRPTGDDGGDFTAALKWWLSDIPNKRAEHKKLKSALSELKWYLAQRDKRRVRAVANWVSAHPGQAFAAVGVLLAVILRVSYAQFYNRLKTTPEEVGLGSAELLAASLPGALIVITIITVLVALIAIPQMAVIEASRDRWLDRGRGQQDKTALILFGLLVVLNVFAFYLLFFEGILAALLAMPQSTSDSTAGMIIGGMSSAIGAVCGAAVGALIRAGINRRRGLRPYVVIRADVARNALIANAPTIAFAFLLLFLPLLAAQRADRVKAALPAESVSFLGFPLLAVGAERTQLVDDGAEHGLAGCVLYLGAGDKYALFFRKESETASGTLVRLPSSDAGALASEVTESSDEGHCWSSPTTNRRRALSARFTTSHRSVRVGRQFRVRYIVSRPVLVRVTAWRGKHPIEQVVDSAENGLNGVNLVIAQRGRYVLSLVVRGSDGPRVLDRGRITVR